MKFSKYLLILFIILTLSCKDKSKAEPNIIGVETADRDFQDSDNLFLNFYQGMSKDETEKALLENYENGNLKEENIYSGKYNSKIEKKPVFHLSGQNFDFKTILNLNLVDTLMSVSLEIKPYLNRDGITELEIKESIENDKRKVKQLISLYSEKYGKPKIIKNHEYELLFKVYNESYEQQKYSKELLEDFKQILEFSKGNRNVQIIALPTEQTFRHTIKVLYRLNSTIDKFNKEAETEKEKRLKVTKKEI